jgi:hypothetical protein
MKLDIPLRREPFLMKRTLQMKTGKHTVEMTQLPSRPMAPDSRLMASDSRPMAFSVFLVFEMKSFRNIVAAVPTEAIAAPMKANVTRQARVVSRCC